jgi:PAS domain S-box-containing protein
MAETDLASESEESLRRPPLGEDLGPVGPSANTSTQSDSPGLLSAAIISASPDAVVVIDDTGTIVLSSPAVTTLFGYYPEELVGEPIETLLALERRSLHTEHIRAFFAAPRSRQMGAGLELAGRHREGAEFAVDVSLSLVEVRGRRYAAAFVRDASERKRGVDRLHAVNEITQRLLEGNSAAETLPLVAQSARRLTRSQAVWIVTPAAPDQLEVTAVNGPGTEVLLGVRLSAETSRSAEVMRTGQSEVIEDLSMAENVPTEVITLNLGPGLYVPLVAHERRLGTLVLGRTQGGPQFGPLDVAVAEVFATSTAAAIEVGEVRAELERIGIVNEDERIARDLHDTVLQSLFSIGMSLQAARASVTGPGIGRIDSAVDSLDGVIREIRNTIFRLPGRTGQANGLRDEMLRLADKYADQLGFAPRVAFHGPVDGSVSETVSDHLLKVVAEALSNAARHAHASSVEAIVTIENGWLLFSLIDDGVGMSDGLSAGNGLRNMATRAANLGGACRVTRREPSGTLLEWHVPL